MRKAVVYNHAVLAGILVEEDNGQYEFQYDENYVGPPVSLAMPVAEHTFRFDRFPPFFDGLLPEGAQLEALLKKAKIDRNDLFSQLIAVGKDVVGSVTIKEA